MRTSRRTNLAHRPDPSLAPPGQQIADPELFAALGEEEPPSVGIVREIVIHEFCFGWMYVFAGDSITDMRAFSG